MTKASDNAFPSLLITEGTEPSAPAAGKQRLYIDSTTHRLMRTNSAGVETSIESTSAAILVPNLLNSPPPGGGNDAEFAGTIAPFTAVDGTSGTATLDDSAGGNYDVATRSGWVLMVVGTSSGDSVQLKQDVTLADGSCIVAAVTFAMDQAAASANNEVQIGIGVNADDAGPNNGAATTQMHCLVDSEASGAMRVIGFDGTTALGELFASESAIGLWFLRVDRVGLVYIAHCSHDGFSWTRLGSKTLSGAANNVWIYANCGATMAQRIVVGSPWFRFGTGMAVDPFPLS